MKNPANSNMYEVNALGVLEAYGEFVEGTPQALVLAAAGKPPDPVVRDAITSSMKKLGLGDQMAWLSLTAEAQTLGALDAMTIIEGMDPVLLVVLDDAARAACEAAYRCSIPTDAHAKVFGRETASFSDFAGMLKDDLSKQRAWALLKAAAAHIL